MYRPVKLVLRNLLAHKDTTIEFDEGSAFLIVGENHDDEGQENNGAGKSALIEGMSICLTGSPFRKLKDMDMIHYGEDQADTELHFHNELLKQTLVIKRSLFANKNKPSTLEVELNGKPVKTFPGVREGNKWILDTLGLSREDIMNYFIVSKSKSVSFFGQSDTDKKKIVARFSGTDVLEPIRQEVKDDLKTIEENRGVVEKDIQRLQGKGEVYEEQLQSVNKEELERLKQQRILSRQEQIEGYRENIKGYLDKRKDSESQEEVLNGHLSQLNKQMDKFTVKDFTTENAQLKKKQEGVSGKINDRVKEIDGIVELLKEYQSLESDIQKNLMDEIECPKCSHKFSFKDKEYDLQGAKEQLPIIQSEIEDLKENKSTLQDDVKELRERVDTYQKDLDDIRKQSVRQETELDELKSKIRKKKSAIDVEKSSRENIDRSIEGINDTIKEINLQIDDIKKEEIDDGTADINKKIQENKKLLEGLDRDLDSCKEEYVRLKEFESTFIRFITHLSNKAVKAIELRSNQYLQNMGSDLSIEIEGYKVNSDGSIREKFSTVVSRGGIKEAFIEGFSEGEQCRINIATTLALNSLLNLSSEDGKGLAFIVLDELMGSLDRLGVGLVMESLSKLNQTILAISHVEPKYNYPQQITVTKEDGVATIKTQDNG